MFKIRFTWGSLFNSLVYGLPKKLGYLYLWLRYRNRPYVEYYRAVMTKRAAHDPRSAVGGKWDVLGARQCEFLKKKGLQPHHTLLDIGCGSLRGGLHFIEYLNKGNYYGIDISPEILNAGREFLEEKGLAHKKPHLMVNTNLGFEEFKNKFDYLFAQSVLSHMPKEDIEELFNNLHKVMHMESRFFATFFLDKTYHSSAEYRNFHYPFQMLTDMGEQHRLDITLLEEDEHPRGQRTMRIVLKTAR